MFVFYLQLYSVSAMFVSVSVLSVFLYLAPSIFHHFAACVFVFVFISVMSLAMFSAFLAVASFSGVLLCRAKTAIWSAVAPGVPDTHRTASRHRWPWP